MPGDLKVSNGSTYVATKTVAVSNGSSYTTAKGVWVSRGDGTWTSAWPNLSTVSVSAPAYAVSTASGSNTPASLTNTIVAPTFTVTLSNPAAVSSVVLQLLSPGGSWTAYKTWTTGITGTLTHAVGLHTVGTWQARAVITHTSGSQVTSNTTSTSCTAFSITSTGSAAPAVGLQTSVSAGMSPSAPGGFANTPVGWYYSRLGASWVHVGTSNPYYWTPTDTAWHDWVWVETFPDGSRIHSNVVRQTPVLSEIYKVNGDATDIQNTLNLAVANGVPARFGGTFSGGTGVRIPAGARVTCDAGTVFYGIQMFNALPATGVADGGYRRAGNIVWGGTAAGSGGTFNMQNVRSTAFSISHCPSFTLQNATIYNTTTKGHGIEINSSGGAAYGSTDIQNMPESAFTIKVLNCRFGGMTQVPRTNCNDEAVHLDYAWEGATAATTANDGTPCHNVLVKGNRFERLVTYPYPVALGNHKTNADSGTSQVDMSSHHSHIRFTENVTQWTGPGETSWDLNRGSVDLRGVRYVHIHNNQFLESCTAVGINAQLVNGVGNGYIYITNNYLRACGHIQRISAGYANTSIGSYTRDSVTYTISWIQTNTDFENGPQSNNVYVLDNLLTGWVGSSQDTWLIGCRDVDTLWVNSNDFWGLTNNTAYTGQTGNRIHGSEAEPSSTVTGYQCRNNTWSPNADGSGAVISNS